MAEFYRGSKSCFREICHMNKILTDRAGREQFCFWDQNCEIEL